MVVWGNFAWRAILLTHYCIRAAALQEEVRRLRHEVETIRPPMPRKRVRIDPGKQFAHIGSIMGAIHQSEAEQARRSRMSVEEAVKKASRAAAAANLESMCFQWQLSYVDF
jgi:hypothetical protein